MEVEFPEVDFRMTSIPGDHGIQHAAKLHKHRYRRPAVESKRIKLND
jgi:hypothetical protein